MTTIFFLDGCEWNLIDFPFVIFISSHKFLIKISFYLIKRNSLELFFPADFDQMCSDVFNIFVNLHFHLNEMRFTLIEFFFLAAYKKHTSHLKPISE